MACREGISDPSSASLAVTKTKDISCDGASQLILAMAITGVASGSMQMASSPNSALDCLEIIVPSSPSDIYMGTSLAGQPYFVSR